MSERCIYCNGDIFEIDGNHFCHTINCPLRMHPQEWYEKHECGSCKDAGTCKENDGAGCIKLKYGR